VEAAFAAFDDLAAMPGMGSPKQFRSARLAKIRSWSVPGFRNYLIFYEATDDAIIVRAVTHGARNVRRLLRERR
jgi:toxin ParE1/3/4